MNTLTPAMNQVRFLFPRTACAGSLPGAADCVRQERVSHQSAPMATAAAWGSRDVLDVVLVRPNVVVEVRADRAVYRGVFRHLLRFHRLRMDVTVDDVPRFWPGAGCGAGAGISCAGGSCREGGRAAAA
ncbi:hypothetical protein ACFY0G_43390 [Streptomyces sp. NPDC001552]|uniref:hypothetical protein n=1 Tax=Streptomyces sp. NPDC001552 TaxID=3364587 RepID=UPI0036CE3982